MLMRLSHFKDLHSVSADVSFLKKHLPRAEYVRYSPVLLINFLCEPWEYNDNDWLLSINGKWFMIGVLFFYTFHIYR